MTIGITTALKPNEAMVERALNIGRELKIDYLERGHGSLKKMMGAHGLKWLYVVNKDQLMLKSADQEFYWHPGTSVLKVGKRSNQLLQALGLEVGDVVLDCTLGLGSDALVMATAVKKTGRVIGLEANEYIAFLTKDGLASFDYRGPFEDAATIEVNHADAMTYMTNLEDNSVDVVYLDPMFQMTQEASSSIQTLKGLVEMKPLDNLILEEGLRVCRKRVVVKERIGGGVFKALKIMKRVGEMRYGKVVYGILEKKESTSE